MKYRLHVSLKTNPDIAHHLDGDYNSLDALVEAMRQLAGDYDWDRYDVTNLEQIVRGTSR